MTDKPFTVGQRVIVVQTRDHRRNVEPRREPATVTKVGRTLVTACTDASWPGEIVFRMEDGIERSDFPSWTVYTPEQLADKELRDRTVAELSELGIRIITSRGGFGDHGLSTRALRRILATVAADRRTS